MSRIVALNSKYGNEDESESTSEEKLMLTREAQVILTILKFM